jgi:glucuronoarabinoxylan endo-1,4-beta-xylanase
MNAATITSTTFTVTPAGGSAISGSVNYSAGTSVATFIPTANLAYNTTYTATISTAVMSSTGGSLAANYSWTFTTQAAAPPTIALNQPSSGATNVPVNEAVEATFSTQMNPNTINASTFTLTGPGSTSVSGIVSYSSGSASATFTPSAALTSNTVYSATITTGAQSSAGTALASNYVWSFTTAPPANQVSINFSSKNQTIRGFGGSTAWLGAMNATQATALFGSGANDLNLNILRVRIDPEGSASGGGTYGKPYETGEWDYELTNGQEAQQNNPNAIVFATPWTPPSAWKLNGNANYTDAGSSITYNEAYNASCSEGTGYCGGYLNPTHYTDYVNFLKDFVSFMATATPANPVNLYAISMQNEPEENVTYESCVWSPDQMDSWVAGLTTINGGTQSPTILGARLMMPESDSFHTYQAAPTLSDGNAVGNVSIVAGHIYGTAPFYYTQAENFNKDVWMTEYGPLNQNTPTWAQAISYGQSVSDSLATGQWNAFVWWGLFGDSASSGATAAGTWGLINGNGTPTLIGYAVGQFSKWVQPGYQGVTANPYSPTSGVYVSAFTGNGHYVIVAINENTTASSETFTLTNSTATSLTPYQSTSSAGWAAQSAVSVSGGQFTYTLPAQSITTFYQ